MQTEIRTDLTATYSPEDNKLRLYSFKRLDKETYNFLRSNGFKYAPKQQLFVTPMWTPRRAKLLINLCGSIEDEQTTMEERAEQRADRFTDYKGKRKADAEAAYKQVNDISQNIPMGQPILIGHHSEKRARRDAKRIESGMQKAVKMWETSEYWEDRAQGAIDHANYKTRPDVRIRRIKKLEAEKRKFQKTIDQSKTFLKAWTNTKLDLTLIRAKTISNYDHLHKSFSLTEYPRAKDKSQYEGSQSLWSALSDEIITPEQARDIAVPKHNSIIKHYTEWLNHTLLRLNYEKAILKAQGHKIPEKKKRPKQPPLVNYLGEGFHPMTKAEWKKKYEGYKSCRKIEATEEHEAYRVRKSMHVGENKDYWALTPIFITDQKVVEPPKKECVAC